MKNFDVGDSAPPRKGVAPPHNLDAEQGVLGALLFDNALLEKLPPLAPEQFYDPVHARIFQQIARRVGRGQVADALSLAEFAREDVGTQEIGGAGYLLILVENAARLTSHAIEYAEIIRATAARRVIIKAATEALEAAQRPSEEFPIAEIVERAESALRGAVTGDSGIDIGLREAGALVADGLRRPLTNVGTGLVGLDRPLGGLYAPDLIIIAARPAMGKTSLAVNLAVNVARASKVDVDGHHLRDRVVAFFSMEMGAEQLAGRALARSAMSRGQLAFSYSDMRSRNRPNADSIAQLAQTLPDMLRINERGAHTIASLRAACRDIRSRYKALDLIVVDYLQLMADASGRRDGRVQEITAITAGLKALAKDMHCPVIALSQLSRAVELRQDKRPQLSDLRESGSIEQDADIVLMVYREHYYLMQQTPQRQDGETETEFRDRELEWEAAVSRSVNKMEVAIAKHRHGPTGVAELWCDLASDAIQDSSQPGHSVTHRQYWRDKD